MNRRVFSTLAPATLASVGALLIAVAGLPVLAAPLPGKAPLPAEKPAGPQQQEGGEDAAPVEQPPLPEKPPVPDKAPPPPKTEEQTVPSGEEAPVPEPRPAAPEGRAAPSAQPEEKPARPAGEPSDTEPAPLPGETDEPPRVENPAAPETPLPPPPPPPSPESPYPRPEASKADESACRERLRKLGVTFEERPAIEDPLGCAIHAPLAVTALSSTVKLEPEALLDCAMAEKAALFVQDIVTPAAEKAFGSAVTGVAQDSAYVCRPRHGTLKLSEHAFGNALDIAAFTLADGTVIQIKDYGTDDPKRNDFLWDIRKAACGPFKTVLGPGSDSDHAMHFHFDLAPRKSGSTFCQ